MKVWVVGFDYDCNGGHRVFATKAAAEKAIAAHSGVFDGPHEIDVEE